MKALLRKFYHNHYRFKPVKILGRVACLGNEIITQLNLEKGLINHQKSRVDFLLDLANDSKIKPNDKEIIPLLEKNYISGTIYQQQFNFFSRSKPDIIIMDSFSELTDQLFENKLDRTKFLANYSDIRHDEQFNSRYITKGLLNLEQLYDIYHNFFEKIKKNYPATHILFIHFPTTLDKREKFQERGKAILHAIEKLSLEFKNLHSISIEDEFVYPTIKNSDELKDFPYHYGTETYKNFVTKVIKTIDGIGLNLYAK